jgi:alpha-ketoglutarate-dependent taurine dioxygenase
MAIPVRKCDAALGAEIVFDLSRAIDDRTFAELEGIFHDNIVVFFPGSASHKRAAHRV